MLKGFMISLKARAIFIILACPFHITCELYPMQILQIVELYFLQLKIRLKTYIFYYFPANVLCILYRKNCRNIRNINYTQGSCIYSNMCPSQCVETIQTPQSIPSPNFDKLFVIIFLPL
jgi:hypothetical protein